MMNKKSLELYVHIPFCARKCAYCDFLSFPGNERTQRVYIEKLIEEIRCQSIYGREHEVVSVFVGGGTPSVLKPESMEKVLNTLKDCFDIRPDAEITIEANPGTVRMEGLLAYKRAGVNRISIGLQSADDKELKYLGRIHTYDEFLKSYQRVRLAGFENVNVDLISAIPGQTVDSWRNTLKKVTMLKPEHISAYSLIVEKGTPYYDRYIDHMDVKSYGMALPDLPDEDSEREMYYLTQEFLMKHGYERYEISNYSQKGYECRHNIGYWTGVEYLGLGLGASSYIGGYRFHNTPDMKDYCNARFEEEEGFVKALRQESEHLTVKEKMEECMFLGLRLIKGVSVQEFFNHFGRDIYDVYGDILHKMEKEGLMELKDGSYRLTIRGIDISNFVMSQFFI